MTIDMKKIRPGCILPCRERVVESVRYKEGSNYPYKIKFVGDDEEEEFSVQGKYYRLSTSWQDITTIIEPPFDWDAVKPGMAFTVSPVSMVYYIGPDLNNNERVLCEWVFGEFQLFYKKDLTRAPEHDKEI
jgi:hypothetical protein